MIFENIKSDLKFDILVKGGSHSKKYCSTSLYIVHPIGEYIRWGSSPVVQILKLVLYITRSNPVLNTLKYFVNTSISSHKVITIFNKSIVKMIVESMI